MSGARGGETVVRVRVRDRDGLHARPCARVAEIVVASGCDVEIVHGGRTADGKSIFAMLGLAVPGGAEVEVRVRGARSGECAGRLVALLSSDGGS